MASSAKKAGILQFAGDGFDTWKFRVVTQLSAHGVRAVLEEDAPEETASEAEKKAFNEKDEKAKAMLVSFIADSHLEDVRDKETAKAMWESLETTYAKKGFAAQTYIRRSLAMLRMEEGCALKDHFRNFDELVRQLKDAGAKLTDLDQVSQLFISLPPSYDVVTTAIENLDEKQLTLATVKSRLLAEEQKRNGREPSCGIPNQFDGTALAAKNQKQKRSSREGNSFPGKCYGCGAFGHKRSVCPRFEESRERAQAVEVPVDREIALVGSSPSECSSTKRTVVWILDSGASRHMAKEAEIFREMEALAGPVEIESAKINGSMNGVKQGTIKGTVSTRSGHVRLAISKVLFVPSLKFNLLSLGALLNVGVKVDFKKDRAVLTKAGGIIGEAIKKGNLYYLTMEVDTALATGGGIRKQETLKPERVFCGTCVEAEDVRNADCLKEKSIPLTRPQLKKPEGDCVKVINEHADQAEIAADDSAFADVSEQEGEEDVVESLALPPHAVGKSSSQDGTTPRTSGRECRTSGGYQIIHSCSSNAVANNFSQIPMSDEDVDVYPDASTVYQDDGLRASGQDQPWTMMRRPVSAAPSPHDWASTMKADASAKRFRYKTPLVATTFEQRKHIIYEEACTPGSASTANRTVYAAKTTRGFAMDDHDRMAYSSGKLHDEPTRCCKDSIEPMGILR